MGRNGGRTVHCDHLCGSRHFEWLAIFCNRNVDNIPLTFILGFYVTFVIGRWWSWYLACPWPDHVAFHMAIHIGECSHTF